MSFGRGSGKKGKFVSKPLQTHTSYYIPDDFFGEKLITCYKMKTLWTLESMTDKFVKFRKYYKKDVVKIVPREMFSKDEIEKFKEIISEQIYEKLK